MRLPERHITTRRQQNAYFAATFAAVLGSCAATLASCTSSPVSTEVPLTAAASAAPGGTASAAVNPSGNPSGNPSTPATERLVDESPNAEPSRPTTAVRRSVELEIEDDIVLAIHGGAGTILRERMTPELDRAYRAKLSESLLSGYAVLARGGSSLDAVEAAIVPMEDSHLFNSGRGAVLNDEGEVELDASIMDGASGFAGAVAGARGVRHPIQAARKVMDESEHVLLSGAGADRFAEDQGLETMDPSWFVTPHRQRQLMLLKAQAADRVAGLPPRTKAGLEATERLLPEAGYPLPVAGSPLPVAGSPLPEAGPLLPERRLRVAGVDADLVRTARFGTVGCVALDNDGHLAAGTSTGGMARKAFGRIGDSPIIGAGTWADDRTCAVSCTGHGEFFIRKAIAHQIHARMLFGGAGIEGAARATVLEEPAQRRRLGRLRGPRPRGPHDGAVHDPRYVPRLGRLRGPDHDPDPRGRAQVALFDRITDPFH